VIGAEFAFHSSEREESMRILVVGAGALGGYFGGRLLQAGADVTFLLRPRRVAQLARTGLVIRSPKGDLQLPAPPSVQADAIPGPYDVVIVGCKAYDLAGTMDSFAPAVGPETVVLPLLNGMRHLDDLAQRFGQARVLGGLCLISASVDSDGIVLHHNELHGLTYGELDGSLSPRVRALEAAFGKALFDARASQTVRQDMWEKWMFIASAAGMTCLMRASVGDIVEAGGSGIATGMFDECAAIAAHNGFAPRPQAVERGHAMLTAAGSPTTASMFKDIERGAPIEADHILGDLLRRGSGDASRTPLLRIAYVHLKAYEARRARESRAA
jgi:2-dehydropantoate 2-reductase